MKDKTEVNRLSTIVIVGVKRNRFHPSFRAYKCLEKKTSRVIAPKVLNAFGTHLKAELYNDRKCLVLYIHIQCLKVESEMK